MNRVGRHILFWISYVLFKTYLNVTADSSVLLPDGGLPWSQTLVFLNTQLVFLLIKVPLVYACFYILDQYLGGSWRWMSTVALLMLAFILGMIGMTILNHEIVLPLIYDYHGETNPMFAAGSMFYHLFTLVFVVGAACSIRLVRRQYQSKLRESTLELEKSAAELKYLKGQVNPHFLFNTLNNIYSLARKKSDQTAEAVMKLAQLMRFMLYEAGHARIKLIDELKLIKGYIDLEKLRYDDRLTINFTTSLDDPGQEVAPLILIHFVENAFKHGASESRAGADVSIHISLSEGTLSATISNSKGEQTLGSGEGIGLENIRRQLEILYPKHKLDISQQADRFSVHLEIPLSQAI